MKKTILILSIFLIGCSAVSKDYRLGDNGKLYLHSKLTCKGAGCKADHEKRVVEGGTVLPTLPTLKIQN